jgi:hypothetical protein
MLHRRLSFSSERATILISLALVILAFCTYRLFEGALDVIGSSIRIDLKTTDVPSRWSHELYTKDVSFFADCGFAESPDTFQVSSLAQSISHDHALRRFFGNNCPNSEAFLVSHDQDLTPLLKSRLGLQNACLSNPSIMILNSSDLRHIQQQQSVALLLVSIRIYWSLQDDVACNEPDKTGGKHPHSFL